MKILANIPSNTSYFSRSGQGSVSNSDTRLLYSNGARQNLTVSSNELISFKQDNGIKINFKWRGWHTPSSGLTSYRSRIIFGTVFEIRCGRQYHSNLAYVRINNEQVGTIPRLTLSDYSRYNSKRKSKN